MSLRSGFCLLALLLLLVTAAFSAGPFATLAPGNGTGGKAQYYVGSSPRGAVIYDNGTNSNIAVANDGDNTVTVLQGSCLTGTCNYTYKGPFAVGVAPVAIDKGHFRNRNFWDLVVVNNMDDTVTILQNDSSGTNNFTKWATIGAGDYPQSVVVGDFDGNGRDDIAVTNAASANPVVTLMLNKCTAWPCQVPVFTVKTLPILPNAILPWGIAKGTFTTNSPSPTDDRRDLVVANYYSRYYGMYGADALLNTRTSPWNSFQAPVAYSGGFYAPMVATGHFTFRGGSPPVPDDFAVTNYGGKVQVFLNIDGNGTFSGPVTNNAGTTTYGIVNVGNVAGNSLDDLVVTNMCANKITVLVADGAGVFHSSPDSPIAVGRSPIALAFSTFGVNGKMLVVVNKDDNNIMIMK